MDFGGHPPKSAGGTSWGATLGAGGRGVMRAAAGGKTEFNFSDSKSIFDIFFFVLKNFATSKM